MGCLCFIILLFALYVYVHIIDVFFPLRCEKALMGWVTVRNCVRLYTTADEIGAETLRDHCSALISTHWVRFSCQLR